MDVKKNKNNAIYLFTTFIYIKSYVTIKFVSVIITALRVNYEPK